MLEPLKNSLLASLGLASLAQEKLRSCVKELIEKGELTKEQGSKLVDSFIARGEKDGEELSQRISQELRRWIEKTPLVSRQEYDALEDRVRALEAKLASEAPEEVEPLGNQ